MDSVHSSPACLPAYLIVIWIGYFNKFQKVKQDTWTLVCHGTQQWLPHSRAVILKHSLRTTAQSQLTGTLWSCKVVQNYHVNAGFQSTVYLYTTAEGVIEKFKAWTFVGGFIRHWIHVKYILFVFMQCIFVEVSK